MKKVIFGFLCFCSVIESINILFISNKLGIFGTILMLSMSLGMTYFFYHLATKDNRKPIHNQIKATVQGTFIPQTPVYNRHKADLEDLPLITDEQLEIEREKIKANKLKRRFTFSDFALMFFMLSIPIFG